MTTRDASVDRRYQNFPTFATVLADYDMLIDHMQALSNREDYSDQSERLERLVHPEKYFDEYADMDADQIDHIAHLLAKRMEETLERLCDALRLQADEDEDLDIYDTLQFVDMYVGMYITMAHKHRNAIAAISEKDGER